jgi:hypothetical protein
VVSRVVLSFIELVRQSYPCVSLVKHHAMKTYGVCIAPLFLTFALDGSELLASRLCHFTHRETVACSHPAAHSPVTIPTEQFRLLKLVLQKEDGFVHLIYVFFRDEEH